MSKSHLLSLALLAALPLLAPARAQAQVEVAAGASATRDNETTAVASVAWLPEFRPLSSAVLRWELGAIHVRGRDDTRYDLEDEVTVAHAGLRYERTDNGLTLGFGVGAQAGETDALSGDPQFVTTAGWRWGRFSLLGRHISNASLDQPNDGETMLVAAWRF
ncbi:acyloxyacyl hydrolase [Luteimonas sp. RD2P54]|uniref:Acyloxyacyl hydrolase n=1 Tax=Luteimonas endophytica TaxID=3042023 RepID=A0ABT6JDK4_9GAMM|nr:acyloxyacyl hydrolase [Luteimonas endophytica]MDH5824911.1 acyloxyacyl hydrolase [Luteimonas endophytica]